MNPAYFFSLFGIWVACSRFHADYSAWVFFRMFSKSPGHQEAVAESFVCAPFMQFWQHHLSQTFRNSHFIVVTQNLKRIDRCFLSISDAKGSFFEHFSSCAAIFVFGFCGFSIQKDQVDCKGSIRFLSWSRWEIFLLFLSFFWWLMFNFYVNVTLILCKLFQGKFLIICALRITFTRITSELENISQF